MFVINHERKIYMTKQQEKEFEKLFTEKLKEQRFQGLKAGATGILGAVLNMCNDGKSVEDIKQFCVTSLGMPGMK